MERLTKKNPGTNLERLLNFAIAKDEQVVLDYGFEKKPLVQVVVEKAKEIGCDASEQAVMWEGQCMECDCAVALMNMLAVQAAELHARLSKIEDILGDDYDLDRLRELAQADRDGRCVVVPVKLGQPVYCLQDYFNDATMKSEKRVKCRLVDFIPVASKMFETNGLIYQFSEIGKTVFLTREEAEAKLKEREKNG